MPFQPIDLTQESSAEKYCIDVRDRQDGSVYDLTPIFAHGCSFTAEIFEEVLLNLIKNPNINSSYLFRADILHDSEDGGKPCNGSEGNAPVDSLVEGMEISRQIVRKLIPRNPNTDAALVQTCSILKRDGQIVVLYLPHVSSADAVPFYHPAVRALAFAYTPGDCHEEEQDSEISLHYCLFPSTPSPLPQRLHRTGRNLLATVHKHGQGTLEGYTKRVQHDQLVPQARYQDTYTRLKLRYAKELVQGWQEVTDPGKHVFEDLGIAAFLIEVWTDMYSNEAASADVVADRMALAQAAFPGFVDVGCGNGLLVNILLQEGWRGWGFDARRRKSWDAFPTEVKQALRVAVLLPGAVTDDGARSDDSPGAAQTHDGVFAPGTFIISNHADELTGWTPMIGALSGHSPFLIIPCCSHDLSGAKFRAKPPKNKSSEKDAKRISAPQAPAGSAYAALVEWVANLASDVGYDVEREMLRIPSTRNAGLVGRRVAPAPDVDVQAVVERELARCRNPRGWAERAMKLTQTMGRGQVDKHTKQVGSASLASPT